MAAPPRRPTPALGAICDTCADKLARGESITARDRMRLIELPLNARLEDVIGGLDERSLVERRRARIERGLLSHADQNLLYIDEANARRSIADAIHAAGGRVTVPGRCPGIPLALRDDRLMNPRGGCARSWTVRAAGRRARPAYWISALRPALAPTRAP
jgi:hypothetical protein